MAFWFWLTLGAVLLVALLVLLAAVSLVRIRIRYAHSGSRDQMIVIVRALYGAYRYRVIIPGMMIKGRNFMYEKKSSHHFAGKSKLNMPKTNVGLSWIFRLREFRPMLRGIMKKVECTRYRLDFRVGTGDAPSTAVLSGVLWTVYGCAVAITGEWVRLRTRPYGEVMPVYREPEFSVVWEADFRFRAGPMLAAVLRTAIRHMPLRDTVKQWKQWRSWMKGPQSA